MPREAVPTTRARDTPATIIGVSLFYYVAEHRPDVRFAFIANAHLPEPERRASLTLTYRPHHACTGAPHKTEEEKREREENLASRGETMRSVDDMRANLRCAALSVKPTNGNRSLDSRVRKGRVFR